MFPCIKPDRSLFYFKKNNRFRKIVGKIVESKIFEAIIMLSIFANCLILSMNTMYSNNDSNDLNDTLENSESSFLVIFTIECILKIILYGFVLHPKSYLRNFWNILDFGIVLLGFITLILTATDQVKVDVKALRAFRVLRPLRLISRLPSLQIVLNSILIAMKPLANIGLLVLFLIIVFSIVGMNLFSGQFHFTCYNNVTNAIMPNPIVCSSYNSPGYQCEGLPSLPQSQKWACNDANNISGITRFGGSNNGITNLDNVGSAMLTVFQIITKQGWSDILYMANNANGNNWPWVYFIILIILGSYFILNLIVGILSGQFTKEKSKVERRLNFLKEKRLLKETEDYLHYKDWIEYGEKVTNTSDDLSINTTVDIQDILINEDNKENIKYETAFDKLMEKIIVLNDKIRPHKEKCQNYLLNIIKSRIYFIVIFVLVFINSVIMGTEFNNQPVWLSDFQDYSNLLFIILFTIETILKLFTLGIKNYFKKPFNIFDFIIITVSIIELSLNLARVVNNIGLSILRSVRLLRIFKLTKHWDGLKTMVNNMVRSIRSILSLILLIALFMVIAALLGMQLFGGRFNFRTDVIYRSNFDDMFQSIMNVYRIMTAAAWNEEMYKGILSFGSPSGIGSISSLYFVIVLIIGNYILLNVFFAIILEILDRKKAEIKKVKDTDSDVSDNEESELEAPIAKDLVMVNGCPLMPPNVPNDIVSLNPVKKKNRGHTNLEQRLRITFQENVENENNLSKMSYQKVTYKELYAEEEEDRIVVDVNINTEITPEIDKLLELKKELAAIPVAVSCFLFSHSNKFRILCHRLINHSLTKKAMLVIIIFSCILLAFIDPMNSDTDKSKILNIFDNIFTSMFILELVINIIAYGIILHKGAYLRNAFNWVDFFVVVTAILDPIFQGISLAALKTLRVLRVIKTLRTIKKAKELKHLINCLLITMKNVWNIILIQLLFLLIFSIMGVSLFKGRFSSCSDISRRTQESCKGTFIIYSYDGLYTPTVQQRVWTNYPFNYDNILNAILTLFVVSTLEGYSDILYTTIDATSENLGPYLNNNRFVFFYYFMYLLINKFFLINIFIACVVISYQEARESEYKSNELDKNQKQCIEFVLKSQPIPKYIPIVPYRFRIWQVVTSEKFDYGVFAIIILNTVTMSLTFDGQSNEFTQLLEIMNYIFIILFTGEAILKIIAFNFRNYFDIKMNVFDFIVVLGSYVDIIFMQLSKTNDYRGIKVNIFRLFRVLRLVKLLMKNKSIRNILWTFLNSFKTLPWVLLLIILIFYVYSIIGIHFFGNIGLINTGSEINLNNNFQTLMNSFVVLFRCVTGENWHRIMISCVDNVQSKCQSSTNSCGTILSYFYFTSFYILTNYLIMNLFLAVIIDNFDYLTKDHSILGPHHLEEFIEQWTEYDINAKGRMKPLDVVSLLTKINPPLGFGKMCSHDKCMRKLMHMNMPLDRDGTICFHSTLFALVRQNLRIKIPTSGKDPKPIEDYNEELIIIIKKLWRKTDAVLLEQIIPSKVKNTVTVGKFYATFLIQDLFRKYKSSKICEGKGNDSKLLLEQEETEVFNVPSIVYSKTEIFENFQAKSEEAIAAVTETYNGVMDSFWNSLKNIFIIPSDNELNQ